LPDSIAAICGVLFFLTAPTLACPLIIRRNIGKNHSTLPLASIAGHDAVRYLHGVDKHRCDIKVNTVIIKKY